MTEQLFGVDGIYGPDIRARIEHQSSQDQFEARGGKLPRRRPAPKVTEIHAGSVIERRRMEGHRRPRATRRALSRVSRPPHRYQRGIDLLHRRQRPHRCHRRAGEGLRHPDSHESLLQRHRAVAGLPHGLRQSSRQRRDREARGREDARADAPARADRSAQHARARSSTRFRRCSRARSSGART